MTRKALFFDVDGTLVNNNNEIIQSTIDSIKKVREKGNLVFINSGRPRKMLTSIGEQINCDGLLCGCGTEIIYNDKVYFSHHLSSKDKDQLLNAKDKYNIEIIAESNNGVRFSHKESRFDIMKETLRMVKLSGAFKDDYYGDYPLFKCCIKGDKDSKLDEFIDDFKDRLDFIDRHDDFYECIPKGYSKGSAVKWVQDYFNIEDSDTYVFGDTTNDLDMFKLPVNAIAMGFHDKELEEYASFITDNIENHGIKKAMEHFNLI